MSLKNRVLLLLFGIILFFSFTLPQSYFFWSESIKSVAASLACFILSLIILTNKKIAIEITSIFLLFAFVILCILMHFYNNNFASYIFVAIAYFSMAVAAFNASLNLEKNRLTSTLAIALTITSATSIVFQNYQINDVYFISNYITSYNQSYGRPYANIGQPNMLGILYVQTFYVLIYAFNNKNLNPKLLFIFCVPLAYGIQLTGSRTAYLSLIIGSLICIFFLKSKSFKFIPFALISFVIFFQLLQIHFFETKSIRSFVENLNNGRFEIWLKSIQVIKDNVFFGAGVNETARALYSNPNISFIESQNSLVSQAHSLPLDLMLWFGLIPGFLIYVALVVFLFLIIKKSGSKVFSILLLSPFFIHSHLEYPLYYMNNLALFFIILGLLGKRMPDKFCNSSDNVARIVIGALFILPAILLKEIIDLEGKLIEQKIYAARIHGAVRVNLDKEYFLDLPAVYIKNMGDFRENKKLIDYKSLIEITNYVTIPSYYWLIADYYYRNKDLKSLDEILKKSKSVLSKDQSEELIKNFQIDIRNPN